MCRTFVSVLILLTTAACSVALWQDVRLQETSEGLVRTTLDNGLKIVLVEDHSAPVVALNVWVQTGSADERPAEGGMAHVFEHMLFKGTERRALGEIASTVEAAGGHINAFTSFDMTVYHITMASCDAAVGIDVLADAVQHSTFDPDELAKEKEVVLEEIRRGEDSPGRVLSQAVFSTAYQRHPYRLPVIGTEELVRSFTRDGLLDFFHRWYVPNNMVFVAVGDLDPDATLKQIREAFADAKPTKDLTRARAAEPKQETSRATVVRRDFEQTLLGFAYPATSFRDTDTAYMDLLALILGVGESSRLYRTVKDRDQLVHAVHTSAYTPQDAGLFFVDAQLDPEQIEAAIAAITREIERIRQFAPSEVELERARVNLLAQEVHEKETMQGQARKIGYYETLADGLEAEQEYLERIRRATAEDVRRVAERYLDPQRASVSVLLPKSQRSEFGDEELASAIKGPDRTAERARGEEIHPGIWRYTLANGLRVIVKPNHSIPLVSMRVSFLGGLLAETEDTQGVTSVVAEMLERGTEQRSAAQFAAEVEGIAGSVSGFSGRNSFGLVSEFLKDSLNTGLELFVDALLHPAFDRDEIEKLQVERLAALRRREDNLGTKAFDLFAETLFVGHPYRFQISGTKETIEKLDREKLQDYYATYANPANAVLAVVGDVEPETIVESLAIVLAEWSGADAVGLPEREPPPIPTEAQEESIEKNKQQVHIVMGFPGFVVGDPDQPALDVLTQILAGQGGRLFLELRDKKSLAYAVTAFSVEGLDPGSFTLYIASAPEKLQESIDGLRTELERILDGPISRDELKRAKGFLIGTQAVSLQRFSSQASLLSLDELYGLGATHHLGYQERVDAVTLDDIERAAHRVIRLEAPVTAIIR